MVVDQGGGLLTLEHLSELRAGEGGVEIERDRAELRAGLGRLDGVAVVAAHDRHAISEPDSLVAESAGESVGAAVRLFEGERARLVDDRRLVRVVERVARGAERGGGPPAEVALAQPDQCVGPHQADDSRLRQDPHLPDAVAHSLRHAGCDRPQALLEPLVEHRGQAYARRALGGGSFVTLQLLARLDQGDGEARDPLAPADRAHPLVGCGLDADGRREDALEAGGDLRLVGRNVGLLADHSHVDVLDGARKLPESDTEEVDRVRVAPLPLVGWEQLPEVPEAAGAEQGVDHRVREHVGVRVAREAALVLDFGAAEDQRLALLEPMAVVADADPERHQLASSEPETSAASPPARPSGASRRCRPSEVQIRSMPSASRNSIAWS